MNSAFPIRKEHTLESNILQNIMLCTCQSYLSTIKFGNREQHDKCKAQPVLLLTGSKELSEDGVFSEPSQLAAASSGEEQGASLLDT